MATRETQKGTPVNMYTFVHGNMHVHKDTATNTFTSTCTGQFA
jgi:hypothetical protein